MIKRSTIFIAFLLFLHSISLLPIHAAIDSQSFYQNILSMYKWDVYLPALDLLEAHQQKSYKRELFKAIGYQKTHQLTSALASYKLALSLNPKASNIKKRIKILEAKIEIGQETKLIKSTSEKASYLYNLAKSTVDKKPDLAYRYFIQAYEYNPDLDKNDNGIISEAIVFYKANMRNKKRFPKLFYAVFLQIQGDNRVANLKLSEVLYRSDLPEHLKKLAQRFLEKGEKIVTARKFAFEIEKKKRLKKRKEQSDKSNKNKISNIKIAKINPLEKAHLQKRAKLPQSGSTPYRELSEVDPNSIFARHIQKQADQLMEQLDNNPDDGEKRSIIRALGNTHTQDPSVMAKLLFMLDTPKLDEINHILETIVKIGPPSAKTAIPYLLPLIKKDNKETRFWVMEALGNLKIEPKKVIPALYNQYKTTTTTNGERLIYRYITNFESEALPVLYRMLSNEIGPNKRPIAKILSRMTGKSINDILEE